MSIASAMTSALSGLTAASRRAEVTSTNVANALTEGYVRRVVDLSSQGLDGAGNGVRVTGVRRVADHVLINDRRLADANAANSAVISDFLVRLERTIGTTEDQGSVTQRRAALDTALIEAASRPDNEVRLSRVADAATDFVDRLALAADGVQSMRTAADARIAHGVALVNDALSGIATLNKQIGGSTGAGRDVSGLMDQRQTLVDQVATIIPLREIARDNGQISLFSIGGAILLEGSRPAVLGFQATGTITPDMTVGSGLSGLMIDGLPANTSGEGGRIRGGTLAANFTLRDTLAVEAQTELDAMARDLVERFSTPGLDPTRAPGDAGLFTDAGAAFLPANETGLSRRLALNAAADPSQGGAVWRLRDGLNATSPGVTGDAALLIKWHEALTDSRTPSSGRFADGARSFAGYAADLLSVVSSDRLAAETKASFTSALASALNSLELEQGVDTDQELQDLMLIEQAYAANAKVIQSADEMLKILIGL